jgi:Dolichyl-phosphate-mannose-protein mannosyltransferase
MKYQRLQLINPLAIVLITGLILRILFSFWLSKYYFGSVTFTFGDTFSYLDSFLNLWHHGSYTFNPENVDAYMYRGPVYSFFLGAHYLIFGESLVYQAVALSQCFIDMGSAYLIFLILRNFSLPKNWSVFGCVLYTFNPILMANVPISGTETLAIFVTVFIFYLTTTAKTKKDFIIIGAMCGLGLLLRPYLAVLLPISFLFITINLSPFNFKKAVLIGLLYTVGFSIFAAPWFIRNWVNHGAPTLTIGETSGYTRYQQDMLALIRFYNLYLVDVTPVVRSIVDNGSDGLAANVLGDLYEDARFAAQKAYLCGPSVYAWQKNSELAQLDPALSCRDEVVKLYKDLRSKAIERNGLGLVANSILSNIDKCIFKSSLTNKDGNDGFKQFLYKAIFGYRTAYLLLGLTFLFYLRYRQSIFLIFPIFMILYISVFTGVEIRYLAQTEIILIIYATMNLHRLSVYWQRRRQGLQTPGRSES